MAVSLVVMTALVFAALLGAPPAAILALRVTAVLAVASVVGLSLSGSSVVRSPGGGTLRRDRAGDQPREVRLVCFPLLAAAADDPGLVVRHQLERQMGRGLVPPHHGPNAHEPRAALQVEELALAHAPSDVWECGPIPRPGSSTMPAFGTAVNSQDRDAVKKPDNHAPLVRERMNYVA